MAIIEKQAYRCDRCEHEWYPRLQTEEIPAICPKCKSAYWNKPRRIDLAKDEKKSYQIARKHAKRKTNEPT